MLEILSHTKDAAKRTVFVLINRKLLLEIFLPMKITLEVTLFYWTSWMADSVADTRRPCAKNNHSSADIQHHSTTSSTISLLYNSFIDKKIIISWHFGHNMTRCCLFFPWSKNRSKRSLIRYSTSARQLFYVNLYSRQYHCPFFLFIFICQTFTFLVKSYIPFI